MRKLVIARVAIMLTILDAVCLAQSDRRQQQRPNIIFILVDDLRWDDLGIAGHPFVKTSNIDRIGREGALFRNAFMTTPLCSPSRVSFLTGQYPHTHGITNNDLKSDPYEMRNIIHQPGAAKTVEKMKREMEQLLEEK